MTQLPNGLETLKHFDWSDFSDGFFSGIPEFKVKYDVQPHPHVSITTERFAPGEQDRYEVTVKSVPNDTPKGFAPNNVENYAWI